MELFDSLSPRPLGAAVPSVRLWRKQRMLQATPSRDARGRLVRRRAPEVVRERLEVLHDGREVELVARTGETSEPHALEAMVGLQMRKAHLASEGVSESVYFSAEN